jgi:hypothetical protein
MNRAPDTSSSAAVVCAMFSDLVDIDNEDNGTLPSSNMTNKFVSARTLLLVVNNVGEVVEGMYHHMADDDAGPSSMAKIRPTQFAAT